MAAKEQDEKSKRLRELLSSFYGSDSLKFESRVRRRETLQGVNLPSFDPGHYISFSVSSRFWFNAFTLVTGCRI
jgi:hypothetical protein